MTDPLVLARIHLEHDHQRDEIIDRTRRFAEALTYDTCADLRAIGAELQQILGEYT
jgi:hypothetical protein